MPALSAGDFDFPENVAQNEERIRVLEILVQKMINRGNVTQNDYEEAQQQAAQELAQKYEGIEVQ
jgi:hypothetical protein